MIDSSIHLQRMWMRKHYKGKCMRVYTLKELKRMSVKELVKILVENSMSTNKSSMQLENVILNILSEREAEEYKINQIRNKKE